MGLEVFFVVNVLVFWLCLWGCLWFWLVFHGLFTFILWCACAWFVVRFNMVCGVVSPRSSVAFWDVE